MNRRLFVATFASGIVGTSAGCLGFLDDITSFSASPAIVNADQADEAGYEYQGTVEQVETKSVPRTDESVEVTNYVSQYTRTITTPLDVLDGSDTEAGVFAIITTPQVRVAGKDYNPVGDMSNAEIAERIQNQYDALSVDGSVGERSVEGLETSIDVETFEGEAAFQGQQGVDVFVDVAQPDHDDDHLVIVGVYPDDYNLPVTDEKARIDTMIRGLEHGDDVDADIKTEGE
ncbi:DUF6517 family protein [Halosolutus halophilus]|uniref:DUF6517 family protein n=1 Tax=Halosolutus halophilus TaxID=1552990 RepID=UPI0022350EEC|nr:DUF6517 family protein [Halosolutus halophilus]